MLDQVALACPGGFRICQKLTNHIKLVETWKNLFQGLLTAFVVSLLDHLGVVFEDVCQVPLGQDLFPEVIGLEAMGVRWIAGATVPALVEG